MTPLEIVVTVVGGYTLTLLCWIGIFKLLDCFFSQLDA